ncbi:hypothetical protein L6164_028573 [Bauhinia variegata]|uniref:Uncharacterized protein n=1 Tax=Bauhinia variegata TaxID=167791 RepID=A0ACB9L6L8_BAUVA|nr:hypothetical protein L6164_028573 [Bauhinia variegata]
MAKELESKKGEKAIFRDGYCPMLPPLVDTGMEERSFADTPDSRLEPLKQDKFSSLNILSEVAKYCMSKMNQSVVNEVHLEPELVQEPKSMANLRPCSHYGFGSPLDILADAAEICQFEENQSSLPFVTIPKKGRSSVHKARTKVVFSIDFQGKRLTRKRCCNKEEPMEGEKVEPSKKKRKMNMPKPELEKSPPDLSIEFKDMIRKLEGTDLRFLMQKYLYGTDVNMNNNRLSMPKSQIQCEFLSENEKAILDEREGDKGRPSGVEVLLLDQCLREFRISLKKWDMRSVSVYNLVRDWKRVIKENDLQKGDHIQLWSFRVHGNLCLFLNCKK